MIPNIKITNNKITNIIIIAILLFDIVQGTSQKNRIIDSLKTKLTEATDDSLKINTYIEVAHHFTNSNIDSSINYLNKALILAHKNNDHKNRTKIYLRLGHIYFIKKDYFKALEYLSLAENILYEYPDKRILGQVLTYKCMINVSEDNFKEAKEFAEKALALFDEVDDNKGKSKVYVLLGQVFIGFEAYYNSLAYYIKAYKNDVKYNFTNNIPLDFNNISTAYKFLNKVDSAFYYLRKAIEYNKAIDNKIGLATNYQNLALYFLDENSLNIDSANYYHNKSLYIYQNLKVELNDGVSNSIKAKLALVKKDTNTAILYLKKIIDSPVRSSNLDTRLNAYERLYNLAFERHDFQNAIKYLKQVKTIDDSLKNRETISLKSLFQLEEEFNKEKETLTTLKNKVENKLKRNQFILILLSIAIVLVYVIFCYFNKKYRRQKSKVELEKKYLQQELDLKTRELTTSVMGKINKNEVLHDITNKLIEIAKEANTVSLKTKINKIIKRIKVAKEENLMEDFIVRFNEVHPDFRRKLIESYPDLTPSELKLCSLLKLNLSTKEISNLLGVHPRTIDNSRSKLRKKFKLAGNNISLVNFLNQL